MNWLQETEGKQGLKSRKGLVSDLVASEGRLTQQFRPIACVSSLASSTSQGSNAELVSLVVPPLHCTPPYSPKELLSRRNETASCTLCPCRESLMDGLCKLFAHWPRSSSRIY